MREDKVKETVIRSEARFCEGMDYLYELVMCESRRFASFRIPLYSVRVTMSGEDMPKSTASTNEVFSDPGKAIDFFEKAVDNLATPIDLGYILEDEIGIK